MTDFQNKLEEIINKYSIGNESNAPGFILAKYLVGCLDAFEHATQKREKWHGK